MTWYISLRCIGTVCNWFASSAGWPFSSPIDGCCRQGVVALAFGDWEDAGDTIDGRKTRLPKVPVAHPASRGSPVADLRSCDVWPGENARIFLCVGLIWDSVFWVLLSVFLGGSVQMRDI
ncbi:hypothetical protein F4808DRAFT_445728 [Astrocystis sublimbata]|nr:hypothetical protein F4808DRAFT_445728 [Astrocystis sublimbata]